MTEFKIIRTQNELSHFHSGETAVSVLLKHLQRHWTIEEPITSSSST